MNELKTDFKRFDNKLGRIDNIHDEIVQLERYVDVQYDSFKEKFTNFETLAFADRESARTDRMDILRETKVVDEYKKDLKEYNRKLEAYKKEISQRVDTDLHLYTLEVAEIRKPQAYMQAMMESNNK